MGETCIYVECAHALRARLPCTFVFGLLRVGRAFDSCEFRLWPHQLIKLAGHPMSDLAGWPIERTPHVSAQCARALSPLALLFGAQCMLLRASNRHFLPRAPLFACSRAPPGCP